MIFNLYFSEKRRPNTLYQELSYQEGENIPEGDDANDIAGIVHIENVYLLFMHELNCCNTLSSSLDYFKCENLMSLFFLKGNCVCVCVCFNVEKPVKWLTIFCVIVVIIMVNVYVKCFHPA